MMDKVGLSAVLLFAALTAACGSAAQRCRIAAALEHDPVAYEHALDRCERIATREYVEQVRQDENRREDERERTRDDKALQERELRAAQQRELELRQIRRNPIAPELGSTPKESEALCSRQRGQQVGKTLASDGNDNAGYVCKVGGVPIFAAVVKDGEPHISAVKVFFEERDLPSTRGKFEEQLGPANHVEIENGYRAWIWDEKTPQVDLRAYAAGVAITFREPE
jgi:hypothetical protein